MKLQYVLVVDDSDADLLYARIVLKQSGAVEQVHCLGTAQEALAHLQAGAPADLVLLDLNMPEMDGFGFLAAYGAMLQRGAALAPVAVLTSSPDPADRRRALAHAGVVGYLVKPLDASTAATLPALARGAAPP